MSRTSRDKLLEKYPAVPYVAPFASYIILLGLKNTIGLDIRWEYAVRIGVVSLVLAAVSWKTIASWRPVKPLASVVVGILTFVIWVAPDFLWHAYRSHWLFQNALTGTAATSVPLALQSDPFFLALRLLGTAILVPIIEELFWRGWLMRYVHNPDFKAVPLGAYHAFPFWLTTVLFASEHGPFWDVGLAAGVIYNVWILRTRNLADCVIAHAVTNACLAAYVIGLGQWQFWL